MAVLSHGRIAIFRPLLTHQIIPQQSKIQCRPLPSLCSFYPLHYECCGEGLPVSQGAWYHRKLVVDLWMPAGQQSVLQVTPLKKKKIRQVDKTDTSICNKLIGPLWAT